MVRRVAAAFLVLVLVAALGPRARAPADPIPLPEVGDDPDAWVASREAATPGLLPDEAATVTWLEPETRARTPLAVVYMHGFSADRHELDPVPRRVAEALGANLFHARLAGHGQDPALGALGRVTARDWLEDAAAAVAVGAAIGERVVLVGTSTGGTLAVWAASQPWADRLEALVLVSPNFAPAAPGVELILWPWGNLLVRLFAGPERCFEPANPAQARHWTTCYPSRALLPMMAVLDRVRGLPLENVRVPVLLLQSPDDEVVALGPALEAFGRMGSERKERVEVEAPGDPSHHVLAGDILSPGATEHVVEVMVRFLEAGRGAGLTP